MMDAGPLEPQPIGRRRTGLRHAAHRARPACAAEYNRATRDEPSVDPQSETGTFIALLRCIDSWRAGMPFLAQPAAYSRGQRIISIAFREPPRACSRGQAWRAGA